MSLLILISTSPSRGQIIQTIQISPFSDFDPYCYFETREGKLLEKYYEREGELKDYYTTKVTKAPNKIRNSPGFTLCISRDTTGEKLTPNELFTTLAFLAKNNLKIDEANNFYFILENNLNGYLLNPYPYLVYYFPTINTNKPGTTWVNWLDDSLFFSKR